jgi:hypothetical protein
MTYVDPTWVLPEPGWVCPECGFDYDATTRDMMADTVRGFARKYRVPLTRGLPNEDLDALLRARPFEGAWSALEYACHVRDALALTNYRVKSALEEDKPHHPPGDRAKRAIDDDYNGQDPAVVADQVAHAAEHLADRLAGLEDAQWEREVIGVAPEMTVHWMSCNAIHEGAHHLLDIGRTLRAARGR